VMGSDDDARPAVIVGQIISQSDIDGKSSDRKSLMKDDDI